MLAIKVSVPISPSEFATLIEQIGPFEIHPHLAIALSGGSDSMALTLLAHDWVKARGGTLTTLTVDHGLRPGSAQEARTIQHWCQALGIFHHILTWTPPSHLTGLQNAAREARYALLIDYCKRQHILYLLTAHQREDQTETFFFRLARVSGLAGLACMAPVSNLHSIRLLRPLLTIPKARLIATLRERGHPWIEDPTNQKPIYTRNIIRQHLLENKNPESLHNRVIQLTYAFSNFRNLLENKLASCLTNVFSIFPEGYGILDRTSFLRLPEELAVATVSTIIITLSGLAYPPRSEQLQLLYDELASARPSSKRSFAGLLFHFRTTDNNWLIYREPQAVESPCNISRGTPYLWDKRFLVGIEGNDVPITVRALGKHYPRKRNNRLPKAVLAGLPSFWHLEELVAVPYIHYLHTDYRHIAFSTRFIPAKALAASAFFAMNRVQHINTKDS